MIRGELVVFLYKKRGRTVAGRIIGGKNSTTAALHQEPAISNCYGSKRKEEDDDDHRGACLLARSRERFSYIPLAVRASIIESTETAESGVRSTS